MRQPVWNRTYLFMAFALNARLERNFSVRGVAVPIGFRKSGSAD